MIEPVHESGNGGEGLESDPEARATIEALRRGLAAEGAPPGFTEGVMRRIALTGGREARPAHRPPARPAREEPRPRSPRAALFAAAAVWTIAFVGIATALAPSQWTRARMTGGEAIVRRTGAGDPRASWVRLDLLQGLGAAGLIDRVLAGGEKQGYRFDAYWDGEDRSRYWIIASPVHGAAGDRYFYLDESGVIRFEVGKVPTERSPAIGG